MEVSVKLCRVAASGDGVSGVLIIDGRPRFMTMEPPRLENRENVSCIEAGEYECRARQSPRFGSTYRIEAVPGRTEILFHVGNTKHDTRGCVLLGRRFGKINGCAAVLESRAAFSEFMSVLNGAEYFTLNVIDEYEASRSE